MSVFLSVYLFVNYTFARYQANNIHIINFPNCLKKELFSLLYVTYIKLKSVSFHVTESIISVPGSASKSIIMYI